MAESVETPLRRAAASGTFNGIGVTAMEQPDRYKVVELTTVTDETLEQELNTWVARGWQLDSIRFAMHEGSRRPAMAFIIFVRKPRLDQ